jgi:5-(carboxyamino)imidazole ribonucleotide mutase
MPKKTPSKVLVSVVMGSASDWETMRHTVEWLEQFRVPNEHRIVSAHRTPEAMAKFAREAADRGVQIIVAGAGGAAHLPGMIAAQTWLPVLGVPVESRALKGLDSLLSIAQMPAGVAVGTLAIGTAGAKNAALLAASMIGLHDDAVRGAVQKFRQRQTEKVLKQKLP